MRKFKVGELVWVNEIMGSFVDKSGAGRMWVVKEVKGEHSHRQYICASLAIEVDCMFYPDELEPAPTEET